MKKIIFSQHALDKLNILTEHKILLDKNLVEDIMKNPDKIEKGYQNRLIAQDNLDDTHILRIVYEESEEYFKIITIYPGRRNRYEKN